MFRPGQHVQISEDHAGIQLKGRRGTVMNNSDDTNYIELMLCSYYVWTNEWTIFAPFSNYTF